MKNTTESTPAKRIWAKPELVIISRVADINGGPRNTLHEHNYTQSKLDTADPFHTIRSLTGPSHHVRVISLLHRQDFHS